MDPSCCFAVVLSALPIGFAAWQVVTFVMFEYAWRGWSLSPLVVSVTILVLLTATLSMDLLVATVAASVVGLFGLCVVWAARAHVLRQGKTGGERRGTT